MTKTIEITVQPDGRTTVETRGFVGPECREASRFLQEALGVTTGVKLTAAYHQLAEGKQVRQLEGGVG
jgi:hypothetical protein